MSMTPWHRQGVDWPVLAGFAGGLAMSAICTYTQIRGHVYRNAEDVYFGWPLVHPNNAYRLVSNAFFIDMACMLVVSAATGIVIAKFVCELIHRRQFALRSMFACTVFVATMCALLRQFSDFNSIVPVGFIEDGVLLDVIALRYNGWIMAPIIFGEACVPFAMGILITQCIMWNSRGKALPSPESTITSAQSARLPRG